MTVAFDDGVIDGISTPIGRQSYRGWLPVVSGRLSFSVFGRTTHPTKAIFANVSDGTDRYVAIAQDRNASDAIISKKTVSGRFWFLFFGRTAHSADREQEYLCGKAYIVTDTVSWQAIEPAFKKYTEFLDRFRSQSGSYLGIRKYADDRFAEITEKCNNLAGFAVSVRISRTGITEIDIDMKCFSNNASPRLPGGEFNRIKLMHSLSAQIYFFIKDIGHNHQHHHKTTDTVTDLYVTDGTVKSDYSWRINTLYNIYRTIIEYKRNPCVATFHDSLGLLAYAKSFQKICRSELPKEFRKKLPIYYSAEMAQSIHAIESRLDRQMQVSRQIKDSTRNVILAVFAVVLSYANILQFAKLDRNYDPPEYILWTLRNAIALPAESASVAVFLIWMYVRISDRYKYSVIDEHILRLLQPARKWVSLTFILAFIVLLVWAIVSLLR